MATNQCPTCGSNTTGFFLSTKDGIQQVTCGKCRFRTSKAVLRRRKKHEEAHERYLALSDLSPIQRIQTMTAEFGRYWYQLVLDRNGIVRPSQRRHKPFSLNLEGYGNRNEVFDTTNKEQ